MWLNPQFNADLVTFTEEILNGKLHFLCSVGTSPCVDNILSLWACFLCFLAYEKEKFICPFLQQKFRYGVLFSNKVSFSSNNWQTLTDKLHLPFFRYVAFILENRINGLFLSNFGYQIVVSCYKRSWIYLFS